MGIKLSGYKGSIEIAMLTFLGLPNCQWHSFVERCKNEACVYSIIHLGKAYTSEAMTYDEQFHPSKPMELQEELDSLVFANVGFSRNRALYTRPFIHSRSMHRCLFCCTSFQISLKTVGNSKKQHKGNIELGS